MLNDSCVPKNETEVAERELLKQNRPQGEEGTRSFHWDLCDLLINYLSDACKARWYLGFYGVTPRVGIKWETLRNYAQRKNSANEEKD